MAMVVPRVFFALMLKEFRQLLPLFLGILALAIVVAFWFGVAFRTHRPEWIWILTMGIPCIFAVGAGAVCITTEKQYRSMDWLVSLPIRRSWVILAKLISCSAGLAACWLLSCISNTFLIYSTELVWDYRSGWSFGFSNAVLYSFYLLLLGFAFAWRFRSMYVVLGLLAPMSALPYGLACILEGLGRPTIEGYQASLIVSIVAASGVGFVFGLNDLAAKRVLGLRFPWSPSIVKIRYGEPRSRFAALLWQFMRENRLLFLFDIALIVAMVVTVMSLPFAEKVTEVYLYAICVLGGFLLLVHAAILGGLVFLVDTRKQGVQFLAERGVEPYLLWFARMLLQLGLLNCPLVIYFLAVSFVPSLEILQHFNVVLPLVALGLLAVFSMAQWYSSVAPTPLLTLIGVLPFVGVWAVSVATIYSIVGVSLYLLFSASIIPLAVTFWLSKFWIEQRTGVFFWSVHLFALVVIVCVPAIPVGIAILTPSKATAKEKTEMQKLAASNLLIQNKGLPNAYAAIQPLTPENTAYLGNTEYLEDTEQFSFQRDGERLIAQQLAEIETNMSGYRASIFLDYNAVNFLVSAPLIIAMRIEQLEQQESTEKSNGRVEFLTNRLERVIALQQKSVRRLRRGDTFNNLNSADLIELHLLLAMSDPKIRDRLPQRLVLSAIDELAAKQQRLELRKQLLAKAWVSLHQTGLDRENWRNEINGGNIIANHRLRMQKDEFVVLAYRLAQCEDPNEALKMMQQMSDLQEAITGASTTYLAAKLPPDSSVAEIARALFLSQYVEPRLGQSWHTGWEEAAVELKKEVLNSIQR